MLLRTGCESRSYKTNLTTVNNRRVTQAQFVPTTWAIYSKLPCTPILLAVFVSMASCPISGIPQTCSPLSIRNTQATNLTRQSSSSQDPPPHSSCCPDSKLLIFPLTNLSGSDFSFFCATHSREYFYSLSCLQRVNTIGLSHVVARCEC